VSWRLIHGLLNFIIAVVVLNCSIGAAVLVVVVVDDVDGVGDVGDMINDDEARGAGISTIMTDVTV
jgi:hypothetical protein